jgi:hypothetical protein
MSRESCKIIDNTKNAWQSYQAGGVVDTGNTSAVSFVNTGTNNAYINGFPLLPGQGVSFGNDKCAIDCTKYNLQFDLIAGGKTNNVFVFLGQMAINLFNILPNGASGSHSNVNIFDSLGASLFAGVGGTLTVYDSAVLTALNLFAAQNHIDLGQIDTDLTAFKSANHTDLSTIDTDLTAFKSANHNDLVQLNTDLLNINSYVSGLYVSLVSVGNGALYNETVAIKNDIDSTNTKLDTVNTNLTNILNALNALTALITAGGLNVNIISPANTYGGQLSVETHVNV